MSDLMDAMLRAQAENEFGRTLTDEEWVTERWNWDFPVDRKELAAVARVVLEEAAKVVDDWAKTTWPTTVDDEAAAIAAAIRALLPQEPPHA